MTTKENNLSDLYNRSEISLLLQKVVREQDTIHAAKKERQARLQQKVEEASNKTGERRASMGELIGAIDVEESDEFELEPNLDIEIDSLKESSPSIQDLLSVIKKATLHEALPQAMALLELTATTPLTSVHCERILSQMKRVVASSRSSMQQKRK